MPFESGKPKLHLSMMLAVAPHPKRGFWDVTQLLAPYENVLMAASNFQWIDTLDTGPPTGHASTSHGAASRSRS